MGTYSLNGCVQLALIQGNFKKSHLTKQLRHFLDRLVLAMNGYLPNHGFQLNFIRNPASGVFNPTVSAQYMPPGLGGQFMLAQHQLQTGLALANLPPQHQLQLRAQLQGLGQILMQQQFLQNYSFTNSSFYHQTPRVQGSRSGSFRGAGRLDQLDPVSRSSILRANRLDQVDPAYSTVCDSIKNEILKQLNSDSRCTSPDSLLAESVGGSSVEQSCESSPCSTRSSSPVGFEDIMESRGLKRQLDVHQSPGRKRTRSTSEDDVHDKDSRDLGFYWPGPNAKKELDGFTQTIWRYFETRRQTQDVYRRKMQLREAMYAVIKGVFPYCGLYVVGSSMNGFGNQTSDMDMCLMISQSEIDQKKEATEILRCLWRSFRNCSFLRNMKVICATVPILKFTDSISGVEVDLNINNAVGIRNTHLLNAYARTDWRVAPLILFVKHWARQQNINDASQGTISSYSLVLMVIHYLQCGCNPPLLPSLQQLYPNKFNSRQDIRLLTLNEKLPEFTSPNDMSLGELFVGFLNYYTSVFDYERYAISVRLGRCIKREVAISQSSNQNQWKCLCIEEPFDLSNTSRSVYDQNTFTRCKRVIRSSLRQLRQTGDINKILKNPL